MKKNECFYETKNGWKYEILDSTNEKYKITPCKKDRSVTPNELFKFYALNEYSLDAFTSSYLYASHPNDLNDPFDSKPSLLDFEKEYIVNFKKQKPEHFKKWDKSKIIIDDKGCVREYYRNSYRKLGIISLGSDINNIAMWSYYTNYEGFAIEFDFKNISNYKSKINDVKVHGPFPINYTKLLDEKFKIKAGKDSICEKDGELGVLFSSNIKSKYWEQEKEYRLIAETRDFNFVFPTEKANDTEIIDRRLYYNPEWIKRVYLGYKFFESNDLTNENFHNLYGNEFNSFNVKFSIVRKRDLNKISLLKKISELEIEIVFIRPDYGRLTINTEAKFIVEEDDFFSFNFKAIKDKTLLTP